MFLKTISDRAHVIFNFSYMERTISKRKQSYLKKTNGDYLKYSKVQLLEEVYRILKSNEELSWYIKRLKRETESV